LFVRVIGVSDGRDVDMPFQATTFALQNGISTEASHCRAQHWPNVVPARLSSFCAMIVIPTKRFFLAMIPPASLRRNQKETERNDRKLPASSGFSYDREIEKDKVLPH
jgi:hypothetical protein